MLIYDPLSPRSQSSSLCKRSPIRLPLNITQSGVNACIRYAVAVKVVEHVNTES
jgi:hypothetical protein